jgi:hypothetical protein
MKNGKWKSVNTYNTGGGMFYFVGLIGALIYFIQQGGTFWEIVLGILKALIWPAFFVYHIFQSLSI